MKRIIAILTIAILTFTIVKAEENKVTSSRVTFLANSGFLVDIGEDAIMFDGLFQNGMNKYWEPTEATISAIRKALPPFDKVSLAFVSSKYADHFDPYLATQFMMNNKEVKLICPEQVISKMKIFTVDYEQIKNRIIETTPMPNQYDRFVINNTEVLACRIDGDDIHERHIEKMLYMVNVNGVKVLHTGDSKPCELDKIEGVDFQSMDIDLAFLSDSYAVGNSGKLANELIDAQYNVLMHFEKFVKVKQMESFAKRSKLKSTPVIFVARNEYKDFYINDFIPSQFEYKSLASAQK